MQLHHDFEWDLDKARTNLKKHGVSFDEAETALGDDRGNIFHYEEYDIAHSQTEDRWITTTSYPYDRTIIMTIVWAEVSQGKKMVTRIISARFASTQEKGVYNAYIRNKMGS